MAGEEDPGASLDTPRQPDDEAAAGVLNAGPAVCNKCGGTGKAHGALCPLCGGAGRVMRGIGSG